MNQVDKFHTIFKHVEACGLADENDIKLRYIGKKAVRVTRSGLTQGLSVMTIGGTPLLIVMKREGELIFHTGHPDGLDLLYVDVIKQPV